MIIVINSETFGILLTFYGHYSGMTKNNMMTLDTILVEVTKFK